MRKGTFVLFEYFEDLLEFGDNLLHKLTALRDIELGFVTGEFLAGATDGESFLVQQTFDLPDHHHIVPLVVPAIASALDGFELRKLLLPVSQHVRLYFTQIADFADREVTLSRNRGKATEMFRGFPHRLPRAPSVFVRGGR